MQKYTKVIAILQNQLDKVASVAGIILGIIISLVNLIYSNEYLITIGPMLIVVCGYYLFFGYKSKTISPALGAGQNLMKISSIIFWLCLTASIFVLRTSAVNRPLMYFILTSVAASMIALQILYLKGKKSDEYLILFEIILVSFSVAVSALWVLPSIVGVDPWGHLLYIEDFVNSGHIESARESMYYLYYPITHLNVVSLKLITALGYKEAMFLGIGLPLILSTVFVYLIGCNVANAKVGLLATLLINTADVHLQFGIQLMPTSFGIMLFTIIFYLIIHNKGGQDVKYRIFALVLLLLLVVTHNMSSFVMFLFILCLLIGNYAYNIFYKKQPNGNIGMVTPVLLMFFLMVMLSYWMYAGYREGLGFLEAVVRGFFSSVEQSAGFLDRPAAPTAEYGYWGPILHIAGFIIIYLFGTVGVLSWLSRQHLNKLRFSLIAAVVLTTAFALVFPVFGIRNIMPYRWYAFIYVPLSIIASIGILLIVQNLSRFSLRNIALVLIVSILSFFMITNKFSNTDSPVYASELTQRLAYTESEIAAGGRIIDIYDGPKVVDERYGSVIHRYFNKRVFATSAFLDSDTTNNSLVIWREVMAERPVSVKGRDIVLGTAYEQQLELSHNLIYDNQAVKAFMP